MRFFPMLIALVVTVAMYFAIFDRPALVGFARGEARKQPVVAAPKAKTIAARAPVSVLVLRSASQTVDSGIVLRGRTEASRKVVVRAETSGLVVSEPLPKGSFVKVGQILCQLDPGTRLAARAEARARLSAAKINETVATSLAEKGFGSELAAIARQASLEAAQAGVERAQKDIDRLLIKAPFSGLLESDSAELGALLQPGARCAQILQLDPVKLVGFVPEQDIARIRLGAIAGARLVDGTRVSGVVTFLSRSADLNTRTFRVEVEIANPDQMIRDGATAEIFISFADQRAHLLPQSALTLDDNGALGIRAVVGGKARFFPVKVIRDSVDGVWLSGLPDRIDVIVVGQEYVIDGRRVTVSYEKPTK